MASSTSTSQSHIPWWLWPNVLSLDAPLVAILCQAALARAHKVSLLPSVYAALFLTVWLIYVVDRVLDGFSVKKDARLSARHAFYRRHRSLFIFFVVPAGGIALLWLALAEIPEGIFWRGQALGFIVALYLLHFAARGHRLIYTVGNIMACMVGGVVLWALPVPVPFKILYGTVLVALLALAVGRRAGDSFRFLPKEVVCGYLFAIGCSLSVNFFTGDQLAHPFSPEVLMLALLCSLNCIAVSCYERAADTQPDPDGITQTWPHIARLYPMLLISLAGFVCWTLSRKMPLPLVLFCAAVLFSTILLGVVHHLAKRMSPELCHVLADVAIAVPVLAVVLAPEHLPKIASLLLEGVPFLE
ncbi:hypothetical protein [Roseimicrobium gellanilyticum]|uniref:hypothetical protein n=1 Tax=Roseimicrobium gellanilyticum TaxID=748857 RepID=UPI000DE87716|nr:hypothetical protein [Roseimicrobium gellanilyticum]